MIGRSVIWRYGSTDSPRKARILDTILVGGSVENLTKPSGVGGSNHSCSDGVAITSYLVETDGGDVFILNPKYIIKLEK